MLGQILNRPSVRMAGKALRHPGKAVLRLVLKARLRRAPMDEERGRLLALLSRQFGVDAPALLAEYRHSEFSAWFQERRAALERFEGPYRFGTTGAFECEALYLLVRAARPRVVVDTGVLYGGSTAHILEALARNGAGELHSIDIGRSPDEPPHDHFVRPEVQSRWELIIGDSRRELPPLLRRCGTMDMFHHDSLHTWDHMTWEFETAFPHLSAEGILSSDDIQNPPNLPGIFRENAFPAFCRRRAMQYASFRNLGMAFRTSRSLATPEAQQERVSDPADLGEIAHLGEITQTKRGLDPVRSH